MAMTKRSTPGILSTLKAMDGKKTLQKAGRAIADIPNQINWPQLMMFMMTCFAAFAKADHDDQCDPEHLGGICLDVLVAYLIPQTMNNTVRYVTALMPARVAMYGNAFQVYDPRTETYSLPPAIVAEFRNQTCLPRALTNVNITYNPDFAFEGWNFIRQQFKKVPFNGEGYYAVMTFAGSPGNFTDHVQLANVTTDPNHPATVLFNGIAVKLTEDAAYCFANLTDRMGAIFNNAQAAMIENITSSSSTGTYIAIGAAVLIGAGSVGLCLFRRYAPSSSLPRRRPSEIELLDGSNDTSRDTGIWPTLTGRMSTSR